MFRRVTYRRSRPAGQSSLQSWQRLGLTLSLCAIVAGIPMFSPAFRPAEALTCGSTESGDGDGESPAEESENETDGATIGLVSVRFRSRSGRESDSAAASFGCATVDQVHRPCVAGSKARQVAHGFVGNSAHIPLRC